MSVSSGVCEDKGLWVLVGLTLLEGLNDETISEWTFGVLSAPSTKLVIALKVAARMWVEETTDDASIKAYSNSEFLATSWACRKAAFARSRKKAACTWYDAGICSIRSSSIVFASNIAIQASKPVMK